ncbi:hypothetical protein [Moraxella nasicaprae]|uniref:Uncharacterized protein n=1 Tax=Moraxella nasicaprae TaxID=2904122 RepID=A0ABY6F3L3_9GAMM|nr:hypothetical protein [Moraxella nasicaprae]UXZ04665.1 hypothetical protein LU297_08865 [Moraxella nasicaprae]
MALPFLIGGAVLVGGALLAAASSSGGNYDDDDDGEDLEEARREKARSEILTSLSEYLEKEGNQLMSILAEQGIVQPMVCKPYVATIKKPDALLVRIFSRANNGKGVNSQNQSRVPMPRRRNHEPRFNDWNSSILDHGLNYGGNRPRRRNHEPRFNDWNSSILDHGLNYGGNRPRRRNHEPGFNYWSSSILDHGLIYGGNRPRRRNYVVDDRIKKGLLSDFIERSMTPNESGSMSALGHVFATSKKWAYFAPKKGADNQRFIFQRVTANFYSLYDCVLTPTDEFCQDMRLLSRINTTLRKISQETHQTKPV